MSTDNNENPMNFNRLQQLILAKQKLEREITATRVINLRLMRKLITNKKILAMADQIEKLVSSVNYSQPVIDDLLDRVEAAVGFDLS